MNRYRTSRQAGRPASGGRRPTWRSLWLPLALVLLAYLLRTVTLEGQSFWIDEVQAFYFVDHPFVEMVKLIISPEHNGPLYFLLLWGWSRLTGGSDFALRYFSALFSVLTVALMWQLARTWFGRRTAGTTSLLLATAPFAIWFGQEVKMYALHMALAALTTLLLVRATQHRRWWLWLGYGITLNLLGYSHFFGAFTIATQGILVIATHLRRPRVLVSYVVTMLVVILPYLPVVSFVWRLLPGFALQDVSKGFVQPSHMLQELASEYVLRVSRIYVPRLWALIGFVAIVTALGLYRAWRVGWRRGLWVTGMLILPLAIFYPVSLFVPVFSPKYLSAVYLIFTLVLALAADLLVSRWRRLGWIGLVGLLVLNGWANHRIVTDPYYQRTDFRAAVHYVERLADPDDVIITYAHYVDRAIRRYDQGMIPVIRFQGDTYQPEAFYRDVLEAQQDARVLWLILHQDQAMAPHNRLQEVAGLLYPQVAGVYPNNGQIAVLGYSVRRQHDRLPARATPFTAAFEAGLTLVGYEVDMEALPPTDNLLHPPSNWLHVTLYWQRSGEVSDEVTPFVHLVDDAGGIWGGDLPRAPTVFHRDPPAQWDCAAIIEAHYDVNLNPATPPGPYRLVAGLLDGAGEPVLTSSGQTDVALTNIEILP